LTHGIGPAILLVCRLRNLFMQHVTKVYAMATANENPFSSPQVEEQSVSLNRGEPVSVGKGLRFANYLIDVIAIQVMSFAVGIAVGIAVIASGGDIEDPGVNLALNLGGVLLSITYYIFLEGLTGRTIGKLITQTRVVNATGDSPSFGQVVGRSFARIIPFEAFSFLFGDSRGWHDTLSKTYVVKS